MRLVLINSQTVPSLILTIYPSTGAWPHGAEHMSLQTWPAKILCKATFCLVVHSPFPSHKPPLLEIGRMSFSWCSPSTQWFIALLFSVHCFQLPGHSLYPVNSASISHSHQLSRNSPPPPCIHKYSHWWPYIRAADGLLSETLIAVASSEHREL